MMLPIESAQAATALGGHIAPVPFPAMPDLPAGLVAPKSIGVHGCGGYPAAAARDRSGGATVIDFRITTEGKVASPEVWKSSGSEALDRLRFFA